MQKITMPYGYQTLEIGRVLVHTGKIRVKTDAETMLEFITYDGVMSWNTGKNGTMIISWATTDRDVHRACIQKVNRLLAYVMHKRIAVKYGELVDQVPDLAW